MENILDLFEDQSLEEALDAVKKAFAEKEKAEQNMKKATAISEARDEAIKAMLIYLARLSDQDPDEMLSDSGLIEYITMTFKQIEREQSKLLQRPKVKNISLDELAKFVKDL